MVEWGGLCFEEYKLKYIYFFNVLKCGYKKSPFKSFLYKLKHIIKNYKKYEFTYYLGFLCKNDIKNINEAFNIALAWGCGRWHPYFKKRKVNNERIK